MTESLLFGPETASYMWAKYVSVERGAAFSKTLVQEGTLRAQQLLAAIRTQAAPGAQEEASPDGTGEQRPNSGSNGD